MPGREPLHILAWGAVSAAVLAVFSETLRWLWRVPFSGEERRLNLGLLISFVALFAVRSVRAGGTRCAAAMESGDPTGQGSVAHVPPIALLCFGVATLLHAMVEHALQANTLTAILAALALYGLWGCFVVPPRFAAALSSVLLLITAMPLAALAEGYVGLGARLLTAEIVQQLLTLLRIAVVPAHTILVLERGIAHIDIPCSGLRGLWSGLLGYLLLTWLERRRLGGRFLLGLLLMQGLLFAANVLRVFVLIYVAQVAGMPRVAEALHVPLGLFGFAMGVAFAFVFLRYAVPRQTSLDVATTMAVRPASPLAGRHAHRWTMPRRWLPLSLLGFLAAVWAVDRRLPRPLPSSAQLSLPPQPPGSLTGTPLPLSAGEQEIFSRFGAQAGKWRLAQGSLIVVRAPGLTAFRAHHPPEVCLLAAGLRVVQTEPLALSPGLTVRHLRLAERSPAQPPEAGELARGRQGLYWFQSASATTPDILRRIVNQLRRPEPWLMVTWLGDAEDGARPPITPPELAALAREIHAALAVSLQPSPSAIK